MFDNFCDMALFVSCERCSPYGGLVTFEGFRSDFVL